MNVSVISDNDCTGCGTCVQICPGGKSTISLRPAIDGFVRPVITDSCTQCSLCFNACPAAKEAINPTLNPETLFCASAVYKPEQINSSSGGLFSAFADYVLSNNGVVFGAAYSDDKLSVYHTAIDNADDLKKLRKSKYIQSDMSDVYKQAENLLGGGVMTLFSGTPCQIAGLKLFLKKDYDNLFTIDLICKGVQSQSLWKKYITEHFSHKKIEKIDFRDKRRIWRHPSLISKKAVDIPEEVLIWSKDLYCKAYSSRLCIRYSCQNCHYNIFNCYSDIRIGDFWKIEELFPDYYDPNGVSSAIVLTPKGKALWDKISDNLIWHQVKFSDIFYGNKTLMYPAAETIHKNRKKFFEEFKKEDTPIEFLLKKYIPNFEWNENKQNSICIIGSYNSRAVVQQLIFSSGNKIGFHFSNSAMLPLMNRNEKIAVKNVGTNEFQQKAFLMEMDNQFLDEYSSIFKETNIIVIDLLEERMSHCKVGNSWFTGNIGFKEANTEFVHEYTAFDSIIQTLTTESMAEFCSIINSNFDGIVVINEFYLNSHYKNYKGELIEFESYDEIKKLNSLLKQYYLFLETHLKRKVYINRISDKALTYTAGQHIYGCFPWHFNELFYMKAAENIYSYLLDNTDLTGLAGIAQIQYNLGRWRKSGKYNIGYTSGVYDLFHIGHLNILKQAKDMCQLLIVGISTDELVFDYKNKYPIIPFEQRIGIVKAIKYADIVIPQYSMDKTIMWDKYHFDALFHGDDWKGSRLYKDYEKKFEALNVDVVFLPHTPGISSTSICKKIKEL